MNHDRLKSYFLDLVILVLAVTAVALVIAYLIGERTSDFSVPGDELLEFLQTRKPIVIDLRDPKEISELPLSYQPVRNYPFLDLQKDISQLNVDASLSYLLVCNDGNRSRLISASLADKGIRIPYLEDGLWGMPEKRLNRVVKNSD